MSRIKPRLGAAPLPTAGLTIPHLDIKPNTDGEEMRRLVATEAGHSPASLADIAAAAQPSLQVAAPSHGWVIGSTTDVPLQDIDDNQFNARVFYLSQEVEEMAEKFKRDGQLVPAIGYVANGRVVLTDGQKRLRAARAAGLKTLMVKIKEPPETPLQNYRESRSINLDRSAQTPFDDAVQWQKFIDEELFENQAEIAKWLGVSDGLVSQTLSLNRLPQKVRVQMLERPITTALAVGYEISRLFAGEPDAEWEALLETALEVVGEVQAKNLSSRQVRALIDARKAPKKTRAKAESRAFQFGGVQGQLKVFGAKGQLDLSIKGLSEADLDNLKAKIEALVALK